MGVADAAALRRQELQQEEPPPQALDRGYSADVELVLVDCVVYDDAGNLVVDLESEDIAVYEDGERMRIEFFSREGYLDEIPRDRIRMPDGPARWRPFPRNILIVYDGLNTGMRHINRMRPALHRFVERLEPGDRVELVMLTPDRRLLVPAPFPGRDRGLLRAHVENLPGNPRIDGEIAGNQDEILEHLYGPSIGSAIIRDTASSNVQEEIGKIKNATAIARSYAEEEAERARYTMDALISLTGHLLSTDLPRGPLFVVLISGGLPLRPGISYFAIINERVDEVNEVILSGGGRDVAQVAFREQAIFDLTGDMEEMAEILARLNATLYTIDAQGVQTRPDESAATENRSNLPPSERMLAWRDRQTSITLLADESGGMSYVNSNDFDRAFDEILADASFRYVLGYRPPKDREPGTYVPIRVEVRRPNMRVRAREGYVVSEEMSR